MKKIVILPTKGTRKLSSIKKVVFSHFMMGTTTGLVKQTNEDAIGCLVGENSTRVCIADGHWGSQASRLIVEYWIERVNVFPKTLKQAIKETEKIEKKLFNLFGRPQMDPDKDFTPEAAFTAIEIAENKLSVASYGDCRLLVANNGITRFNLPCTTTWLGAFSHLSLRQRLPVSEATRFEKMNLGKGDFAMLFTDGVDQCVYEKDTISFESISKQSSNGKVANIFNELMKAVFAHGAQDNASLGIFKF